MRVAYDSQIFAMQEYGGISRYFCQLAQRLFANPGMEAKIFAPVHINAYLSALPSNLVCGNHIRAIPKTGKLRHAVNAATSWPMVKYFQPDIVHHTYYLPATYAPKGARRVITVYDMIHERFSTLFPRSDRTSIGKKRIINKVDHVICISENTRRDLLELFDLSGDNVSVVHLGFDRLKEPAAPLLESLATEQPPYLLYVGLRGGYKNFSGLLRAFAGSSWLRQNFHIVCFGGGPLQTAELNLIAQSGISPQQISQVSGDDAKLAAYYRQAAAFVYPSLYEGFGIPPLEAMSLDCPVICSNTSSIPEVVGPAAEYFDPGDVDSIRLALERTLESPERRNELIKLGRERYTQFTWDRCTQSTLEKYRSLL